MSALIRIVSLAMLAAPATALPAQVRAAPPATPSAPVAPAPATAAAPAKVGDNPATAAEILDAVDLCRRAARPTATFEYRLLRDSGFRVGTRNWEPAEKKEARGRLSMGFGKGNVAIFVRHGATAVDCKVVVTIASAATSETVRAEILGRGWARTYAEGAEKGLKDSMSAKFPNQSFDHLLIAPGHIFDLASSQRQERLLFSVTVLPMRITP